MTKINSYKELIAWQKAMDLVLEIYGITQTFPQHEKFGLVSQMNRAVVSVPTNIAEGWGRSSRPNYLQFLRISRGSLMELETLLIIASKLSYIENIIFERISNLIDNTGRILQGLIKSLQEKEINK